MVPWGIGLTFVVFFVLSLIHVTWIVRKMTTYEEPECDCSHFIRFESLGYKRCVLCGRKHELEERIVGSSKDRLNP